MSPSTYPVTGKTVLITGAARGIGADTAKRLAARGAKLSLVGLEPEELEKVAAACGNDAVWFETDVTVRDELDAAVAGTLERFGGIDVVMANAGIASGGTVETMDPDLWERIIHVNLIGVYRTVHATLPHVIERKGYVLPVASLAAFIHSPMMSAYCATKAGVEAFADSLRSEVAHQGVDVGCAYFSWIGTDMVHGGDEMPAFAEMRSKLRGPFGRTYPVSDAGEAVVKRHRDARAGRGGARMGGKGLRPAATRPAHGRARVAEGVPAHEGAPGAGSRQPRRGCPPPGRRRRRGRHRVARASRNGGLAMASEQEHHGEASLGDAQSSHPPADDDMIEPDADPIDTEIEDADFFLGTGEDEDEVEDEGSE